MFSRPGLAILDESFHFVAALPAFEVFTMPGSVCSDVLILLLAGPLLFTDLKAPGCDAAFFCDASLQAGGIAAANGPFNVAHALWRHPDLRGIAAELMSSADCYLRVLGALGAARVLETSPAALATA
jgi:hypothetical protein